MSSQSMRLQWPQRDPIYRLCRLFVEKQDSGKKYASFEHGL